MLHCRIIKIQGEIRMIRYLAVHDFCPRTFTFHPCRLHAAPQMPSMSNTSSYGQLAPLAVRPTAE